MPQTPTFEANRDIYTGSTGPNASPNDFTPDFGPVAQGLGHLASGLSSASEGYQRVEEYKKRQTDVRWATQSVMQERMHLSEWMSKPQNNTDEDYANNFKKYSTERLSTYGSAAPSPEAADLFNAHMGDWVARQYDQSLDATERTRIKNSIENIDLQIGQTMKAFRDDQNTPGQDPVGNLYDNFRVQFDSIEGQFGETSPTLAKKLQEHLVKEAALGVMSTHPEVARKILDDTNVVDEETRHTLLRAISGAKETRDVVAIDQFATVRKDRLAAVLFGKSTEKIPMEAYQVIYPDDQAQVVKAHDDRAIDTYVTANGLVSSVAGKNPGAQVSMLNDFTAKASTEQDKEVLQILDLKVRQNLDLLKSDRATWMTQNNPRVHDLQLQLESETDPDRQLDLFKRKNDLSLQYQGKAPYGASEDEQSYYLGLPAHDRHILGSSETQGFVNQVNHGSPGDVVKSISGILSKYPDSYQQSVVLKDLISPPGGKDGIRQEYQLAFQNKDAWWVDSYVGALSSVKDLSSLDDTKRKDITGEIEKNPTWRQFQQSMVGDTWERAHEVEGFKRGITVMTHALTQSGKTMRDATKEATDMLISSTLGFAPINGQSLAISRDVPGSQGSRRSDADISDIGRRMSVALKYVDPKEVDEARFPGTANAGVPGSIERSQAVRDIVTSNGFFVVGNDGQSASLHVRDDHGVPFEVSDRQGRPFIINFSDLPEFTEVATANYWPSTPSSMRPAGTGESVTNRLTASRTYDLQTGGGMWSKLFGSGQPVTHWPAAAPWIRHERVSTPRFTPTPPPVEDDPVDPSKMLEGLVR